MKIKQWYISSAIMFFNTAVLFIIVNIFLGTLYVIVDWVKSRDNSVIINSSESITPDRLFNEDGSPVNNGKRSSYQLTWFDYRAYENIVEPTYVAQVLDDFYELSRLGFIYQPWVQFSEPPYSGKLVHVDLNEKGFPLRRTINPPNIKGFPTIKIFTMGGSTTFGYNVADEHTWPTFLSQILNKQAEMEGLNIHIEVLNYGRGYYYPSQESMLLLDLLKSGYRPDLVIFMDGVNKGRVDDTPHFTDKFRQNFKNMQFASVDLASLFDKLKWLPIIRLTYSIRNRLDKFLLPTEKKMDHKEQLKEPDNQSDEREGVKQNLNQFEQNRKICKILGDFYKFDTIFFLQPSANHKYSFVRRPLQGKIEVGGIGEVDPFYESMHMQKGIIFLDHLFQLWGEDRRAIIDDCHYSPQFNYFLAQHVADYINLHDLIDKRQILFLDDEEATGTARKFIGNE